MTLTQNLDVMDLIVTILGITISGWLTFLIVEHWKRRKEIKKIVNQLMIDLKSYKNIDIKNIEKDVIKPLKTELKSALKSTENEAFRKAIEKMLYVLRDKEVMTKVFVRSKNTLIDSWYLDDALRNTLDDIINFEIVELAPLLFKRLQQEKDDAAVYEIIKVLGKLGYKPALSYILQLANEHVGKSEDHISHACIIAIGDNIALKNPNALTTEELNQITSVFTTILSNKDDWLIDAVVRCELPTVLNHMKLHDPFKKKLMEALVELLYHNRDDIRVNAVERLKQLRDKRALPYLKKKLQEEPNSTILKAHLERAVWLLEEAQ